jgi:FtsZ-interacting cell division protein YlmF
MVKFSEIPKPLLDKLATIFPEEDYEMFMERYEQMYEMRAEAARNQREQDRRGR